MSWFNVKVAFPSGLVRSYLDFLLSYDYHLRVLIPFKIFAKTSGILNTLYSLFHGFWQSFVTIGSCNHLMRIISRHVGNTKKVRSREDDNYSNWAVINYRVSKGLCHISCLLQIIKPFSRPPQGLLFLVV